VVLLQVSCWNSHIGIASCLKWAPRRAMFVAASTVLTFWIPDSSKSTVEPRPMDVEGAAPSENVSQQ